ncbi:hypothetical protein [Aurantimonas sp. VKM B-3413]|uniref:hypothetical protein n=1 Tax=Aurantimonas sp. VKM B-3413 TaxID=2779401 RepID=UPI001E4996B0|nr:hypothetical protein [Aurantimonas sp. VKM B-3413]MCB8837857.1 hypothetical protein [Aurantimonas sp. VKM B-3413]
MSNYLLTDNDYADLPENKRKKFAAIERKCRASLGELISQSQNGSYDDEARAEYIAIVEGAARYASLDLSLSTDRDFIDEYNAFRLKAISLSSQIMLESEDDVSLENSVRLASRTRNFIEREISSLRTSIVESDLPDKKKEKLLKMLESLRTELHMNRFNIVKSLAIIGSIGLVAVNATAFTAQYRQAYENILKLINADKELEDAERERLGAPPQPLAIEGPKASPTRSHNFELDDEIPF